MPGPCPPAFIALAEQLADAAGRVSLEYFRRTLAVESKQDASPVTVADRTAEQTLRDMVAQAFPDHGIVGEEFGSERADAEYVWVFDPIDGTKAFITGNPQFGNLIALMRDNQPILGVINMPAQGDRWVGALGHPTTFSDARGRHACHVRPCASMAEGIFRTISPQLFKGREALHQTIQDRMHLALYGGDCFSYGQVASGWVDLVIEAGLGVYDYMALVPVVQGAGGVMSDWQGRPLGLGSDGRVVAAGDRRVQAEALALLAE